MNQYIVDVTYDSGEVALFGPFEATFVAKKGERAIDFVNRIKAQAGSQVKEAKIRVLNKV